MTELNTTIHGIDIEKLPSEVKNNPEKLGAVLISEKCYQLGEENKKLKAELALPESEQIAYLKRQVEQLSMDNLIKQKDIYSLQAQVKAAEGTNTGTLVNLDNLVVGALVEFATERSGVVFSIHNQVFFSIHNQVLGKHNHINSVRAFIRHEDGCESYHTYRFDGRSHHCPTHDIIKITPPKEVA
jgi:hypothetical protein